MRMSRILAAPLMAVLLAAASPVSAGPLSLVQFQDATGINADQAQVSSIWQSLVAMGTTEFLGGNIGSFRLDESSMIAGASTLGATEFDNFLRNGSLSSSSSGLGNTLTQRMTSGSGFDLSHIVGSFTNGGGLPSGMSASLTSLTSLGGASSASGSCDPEIGDKLAQIGEQSVSNIVTAALSKEYGFSQMQDLKGTSGKGTGFSALGCLDKLFQNAGADLLFKPPSLGNLTNMLQNWVCNQAKGIAQQVTGNLGTDIFKTGSIGGFFPSHQMSEGMDGAPSLRPGIGQNSSQTFGFSAFNGRSESDIQQAASLRTLFR